MEQAVAVLTAKIKGNISENKEESRGKNLSKDIKVVHAKDQAAQKNTVNATKLVSSAETHANVLIGTWASIQSEQRITDQPQSH